MKDGILNIFVEEKNFVRKEINVILEQQQRFRLMSLIFSGIVLPGIVSLLANHEKIGNLTGINILNIFPVALSIISVVYMSIALSYNSLADLKRAKAQYVMRELNPKIKNILQEDFVTPEAHYLAYLKSRVICGFLFHALLWSAANFVVFILPALVSMLVSFLFITNNFEFIVFLLCIILNACISIVLFLDWLPRVSLRAQTD